MVIAIGLVGLRGPPGSAAANTLGCGALGCAWLPALVLNGLSWIFKILFRLYLNKVSTCLQKKGKTLAGFFV